MTVARQGLSCGDAREGGKGEAYHRPAAAASASTQSSLPSQPVGRRPGDPRPPAGCLSCLQHWGRLCPWRSRRCSPPPRTIRRVKGWASHAHSFRRSRSPGEAPGFPARWGLTVPETPPTSSPLSLLERTSGQEQRERNDTRSFCNASGPLDSRLAFPNQVGPVWSLRVAPICVELGF